MPSPLASSTDYNARRGGGRGFRANRHFPDLREFLVQNAGKFWERGVIDARPAKSPPPPGRGWLWLAAGRLARVAFKPGRGRDRLKRPIPKTLRDLVIWRR